MLSRDHFVAKNDTDSRNRECKEQNLKGYDIQGFALSFQPDRIDPRQRRLEEDPDFRK
jgi:hypothetical protein